MSAKIGARRVRAFLACLTQTGNQTLAAERACVSRSWVCLRRSSDSVFDAACRAAIAEAGKRLNEDPSPAPQPRTDKWRYFEGVELVVRATNGRRTQIARARPGQWTGRTEERFLAALAGTCNVKAACADVGKWPSGAYNQRKRRPGFGAEWSEAVDEGYVKIETGLVPAARNFASRRKPQGDLRIREMTAAQALQLLNMHKKEARGIGDAPGRQQRRERTMEEVKERLMRALEALAARRSAAEKAEAQAAFEAEIARRRAKRGRWRGRPGAARPDQC